ncbi:type III-B CRISPR module RAMP protein Cmr6 [Fundicoccus ignavus]|nr:type III-B CRISPR module RAMP protein Cmr6 [Fundicoccus ignavus]
MERNNNRRPNNNRPHNGGQQADNYTKISNATFRNYMHAAGAKTNNLYYGINYYVDKVAINGQEKFKYSSLIQYSVDQRNLLIQRNKLFNEALQQSQLNRICLNLKAKSPYITGLGSEHITETGITLHPTYGVPFIPGSMLKGVFNQWLHKILKHDESLLSLLNLTGIEEDKTNNIEGSKGYLTFHDSFFDQLTLKNDIMTPHFSDYYRENRFIEESAPNPIAFKVVEFKDSTKVWITWGNEITVDDKDKLGRLICKAINETGLGAKTTVGYGFFEATYNVKMSHD